MCSTCGTRKGRNAHPHAPLRLNTVISLVRYSAEGMSVISSLSDRLGAFGRRRDQDTTWCFTPTRNPLRRESFPGVTCLVTQGFIGGYLGDGGGKKAPEGGDLGLVPAVYCGGERADPPVIPRVLGRREVLVLCRALSRASSHRHEGMGQAF